MDIEIVRSRVTRALHPVRPANEKTAAPKDFLFNARRAVSSPDLPPYYLIYFLLVDLLGYRNLGQFEKIAWSVPVDYEGRAFLIEHRKMGLGIFSSGTAEDHQAAVKVSRHIQKAVKAAKPYFDWRAAEAAKKSHLNVINHADTLFERYKFFVGLYEQRRAEAERRKDEAIRSQLSPNSWTVTVPSNALNREAKWFALASIESFFSWTEHVFILIGIIQGSVTTGEQVSKLAAAEWDAKFNAALNTKDPETKRYYDGLKLIRGQLRNVVAHGAFGKDGEALQFHSGAGAVPMLLPHNQHGRFRFGQGVSFVDHDAIELLRSFVDHLWSGQRQPAKVYLQDYALPLILTLAADGTYSSAMTSMEEMGRFTEHMADMMDRSANMDF